MKTSFRLTFERMKNGQYVLLEPEELEGLINATSEVGAITAADEPRAAICAQVYYTPADEDLNDGLTIQIAGALIANKWASRIQAIMLERRDEIEASKVPA